MSNSLFPLTLTGALLIGVLQAGCTKTNNNSVQSMGAIHPSAGASTDSHEPKMPKVEVPRIQFQIRPGLNLSIPRNYLGMPTTGAPPAIAGTPTGASPEYSSVSFQFFLPDFSGYTERNSYDPWNSNRVDVVGIRPTDPGEGEPDAPGDYPPNVFKRITNIFISKDNYQNLYGLKCYPESLPKGALQELACFGVRDNGNNEQIFLKVNVPPYPDWAVNPQMQAKYFSKEYGGITVVWRTHVDNFPQWREIDQQIWKFISSWRAADPK